MKGYFEGIDIKSSTVLYIKRPEKDIKFPKLSPVNYSKNLRIFFHAVR